MKCEMCRWDAALRSPWWLLSPYFVLPMLTGGLIGFAIGYLVREIAK